MALDVLVKYQVDFNQVQAATKSIIASFRLMAQELQKAGRGGDALGLIKELNATRTGIRNTIAGIQELINNVKVLREAEAQVRPGQKTIGASQLSVGANLLANIEGKSRIDTSKITQERIAQEQELGRAIAASQAKQLEGDQKVKAMFAEHAVLRQQLITLATEQQLVEERSARILSAEVANNTLRERRDLLREQLSILEANKVAIEQAGTSQLGRFGTGINTERAAEERNLTAALKEREAVLLRMQRLDDRAAQSEKLNSRERKRLADDRKQAAEDLGKAERLVATARGNLKDPVAQSQAITDLGGAGPILKQTEAEIARIIELMLELDRTGLAGFAPELVAAGEAYAKINGELTLQKQKIEGLVAKEEKLATNAKQRGPLAKEINREKEKEVEITGRLSKALLEVERLERSGLAAKGVPKAQSMADMAASEIADLPKLEQLFIQAFDGMGRRFTSTLQFAISGAILFGVQQGIRKFLETAIEVERAFADIGTAFEFDIEFARNTTEFKTQLNAIRVQILGLADEFNVLPTEANKAAFSMVARFGDANDALKALRAQLLATKVSTIDQGEALRALSAVAENFAAASLFVQDGLSVEEKLFQRERAAVDGYGKALDIAVLIQQRFGVEVEDVLEGTARLSPIFSQLGFTMEQTAAIVASVSRELGLTGAQAAEKMGRSIGQLTEPSIRDDLLDLAARTSALTLTFEDFKDGETALRALVAQFRNLEQVDPKAAFQLMNIIGQRRELEVVAALFNTTELQDAMGKALETAAGSAEKRFGFLAQTISERLKSIGGGFERLAQNFTELGFLGPLKLAVIVFDELLKKVNQFLELVNTLITEMGILGTAFKLSLGFVVAASSLKRVAGLIAQVAAVGVGSIARRAATIGGGVLGADSGVAAAASGVTIALERMKGQVVNNRIGLNALRVGMLEAAGSAVAFARTMIATSVNATLLTGLNKLTTVFPKMGELVLGMNAAFAGTATPLASLAGVATVGVAAIVGLIFAVNGAIDAFKGVEAFGSLFLNARTRAESQVRIRRAQNPEDFPTDEVFQRAVSEQTLANLQEAEATITGFFEKLTAGIAAVFSGSAIEQEAELRRLVEENKGAPLDAAEIIELQQLRPGEQPFLDRARLEAQRKVIADSVTDMLSQAVAAGAETAAAGSNFGALPGVGENVGAALMTQLADITQGVREAGKGFAASNLEVDVQDGLTALTNAQASLEEFLAASGKGVNAIEAMLNLAKENVAGATRGLSLGVIDEGQAIEVLRAAARQAQELARSLFGADFVGAQELMQDALDFFVQAQAQTVQLQLSVIERGRGRAALIRDTTTRLRVMLVLAQAELHEHLTGEERGTAAEIADAENKIAQLQQDIADHLRDRTLTLRQARVAMARTAAEWFAAQQELITELFKQAEQLFKEMDFEGAQDKTREALQEVTNSVDRKTDELRRQAISAGRNGPINNKINQLNGQLNALNIQIAREKDPTTKKELIDQAREVEAQIINEEIATMLAFAEMQVGVRDQLSLLRAQIVIANVAVKAAADEFGTTAKEFAEAQNNLARLKDELANALLSIDDINRRLGTDLSDDFEQTILDLQLIAEKLQAPGLGGLEEAQLLIEQRRGEMAAARAFFSGQLFDMRFLSETGKLGEGAYLDALRSLLGQVDTTTQQGKEIFLEIQGLIDGMTEDVGDLAFNIPTAIRLPTIFEVRRALAADQLGVNYVDNRQMDIVIDVRDATDVEALISALGNSLGGNINTSAGRFAFGGAGITLGGF